MEFKDKIVKVRAELFISQEQLAKELGCSFSTINRWEKGKKQPRFILEKKFESFCKQKGINFDEEGE